MKKIAITLLGMILIPSCQMEQTMSSSMEKAVSTHVAGDVKGFVQALRDEKFEKAQSMIQNGMISVHEKVDIREVSELAEALSALKVETLLPLQLAAYWDNESLIKFCWEQNPNLYTKQDIDLALKIAKSEENYDAIDFLGEVSKNVPGEVSSHDHDAGKEKVPVGTAPSASHEGAVEEGTTGNYQKDEEEGTTGNYQKDKEEGTTGQYQKDIE